MLAATDTEDTDTLIIESDNCSNQFKSASHFYKVQQLCNDFQKTIVRVWSVAGHGKGDVDHVGGIAKVALRLYVAKGVSFSNSEEMTSHLISKYGEYQDPHYISRSYLPKHCWKYEQRTTVQFSRQLTVLVAFKWLSSDPTRHHFGQPHIFVFARTVKSSMGLALCSQNTFLLLNN